MAILNACDELHAFATHSFIDGFGEFLIEIVYQYACILRFQVTAIVGDDLAVGEGDDITADGKVVVGHLVAYRCGLERTTTFIYLIQVIA